MQKKQCKFAELHVLSLYYHHNLIISFFGGIWPCHFLQGGTKAIDKNVIINFCDKYAVIARFSDKKMMCLICMTKMSWYVILWNYMWWYVMKCCEMSLYVDFHSHLQFHDKTACVWDLRYRWDPSLSMRSFAINEILRYRWDPSLSLRSFTINEIIQWGRSFAMRSFTHFTLVP